ncbi:hypothetical protein AaE_004220 [Aphanomyces astaci]|uniref:Uncharacterized protein n=1 Tax=Aphanomyces astaci TaxID=112090 RepID=A0A6A5APF6_APHAT|nr:hypothetical protein AaE_004220 [Aphanomyces astaci]
MLEFLRIPDNFAIMTGQATKNKAVKCGQKITRAQGHQMLAEHVNAVVGSSAKRWSTQDKKSRYDSYVASYRRALTWCGPSKKIFTIEGKLEDIFPYYNEMNALYCTESAKTFALLLLTLFDFDIAIIKKYVLELHSPFYDSNAGGSNDGNHDDDDTSLAGASNDPDNPNDPENDEYWVANDIEDPGQAMDAPKTPLIEAHGAKATSRGATPVIAGQFPVSEKRLTPRKDFAAVYMDAQSQMAQFECEKFECMKANRAVSHPR